jgi:hypothetical protein
MLHKLKMMDSAFWDKLRRKAVSDSVLMVLAGAELKNVDFADPLFENDLPCDIIIANVLGSLDSMEATIDGDLISTVIAESLLNEVSVGVDLVNNDTDNGLELRHGKRKENKCYKSFWRHDKEASDKE